MTQAIQSTSMSEYINRPSVLENITKTLGAKTNDFITSVISASTAAPLLAQCNPKTILTACLKAASLNLPFESNLGMAYIIPYKNNSKKCYEAQFQLGYKGLMQLAVNTGMYELINVSDVREGEFGGVDRLTGVYNFDWIDDEAERENLEIVGYIGYFKVKSGFSKQMYMSVKDLNSHGVKYSQEYKKYGTGLWKNNFDAMARKTGLKLLISKWGPKTSMLETALLADQAVIRNDRNEYVDNQPISAKEAADADEEIRRLGYINECSTLDELAEVADYCQSEKLKKAYDEKKLEIESKK